MTIFAEELAIQQTRKNGKVNTLVAGKVFDGETIKGFKKRPHEALKFYTIPDAHKLFLVKPEKKDLAARLRQLLSRRGATCKKKYSKKSRRRRHKKKQRSHHTRKRRKRRKRQKHTRKR